MLNTQDWFSNHIDQQPNTLVADRDWLHKLYHIQTGAQFSLRVISEFNAEAHLPLLVVRHDNPFVLDELQCHAEMADLREKLMTTRIPVIVAPRTACTLADAKFGIYCGQHGTRATDAEGLARFFRWLPQRQGFAAGAVNLVSNTGIRKHINSDVRDAFQLFTRAYLNRDLVIQDFDMLRRVGTKWQAIETKRHKCPVSSWLPYLDDSLNFTALAKASDAFGMLAPVCIGYRVYERQDGGTPLVSVNYLKRIARDEIEGERCIVPADHIWNNNPVSSFQSRKRIANFR
jgi:hypothetical protein